ncbi:hypothetical protein [Metabacillus arenae]|uniref:Uncharacterized protein n=1 Tax=Metabacillus arenae TaxID=2771434 RepID=A0A926NDB7_9BACI|nr:hypothetical protein [Metabacillus arenae]MBD1379136.1 hypothetical protein [Metabacillus arenae]
MSTVYCEYQEEDLWEVATLLDLENQSEEVLFDTMKEHKNIELQNMKKVLHNNLHNLSNEDIEYYLHTAMGRIDEEINELEFDGRMIENSYHENKYIIYLNEYKDRVKGMFDEFI